MNLLSVKDAAAELGKSPKTLWCIASRDKARGITTRFVRIDKNVFVNIDAFEDGKIYVHDAVTSKTQEEFEALWFFLIERQSKTSIYDTLASELGKKRHAVQMYIWEIFLGGTETMKKKYVDIMKRMVEQYEGDAA